MGFSFVNHLWPKFPLDGPVTYTHRLNTLANSLILCNSCYSKENHFNLSKIRMVMVDLIQIILHRYRQKHH